MKSELKKKGVFNLSEDLILLLRKNKKDHQKIKRIILKNKTNFGLIFNDKNFTLAVTDIINSYPIFFNKKTKKFSFNARKIFTNEDRVNQTYLKEFISSGYNCEDRTIMDNIKKVQAGEYYIYNKIKNKLKKYTYYSYIPSFKNQKNNLSSLSKVFDSVFNRVDKITKDKPICLFLSAGLDSRFLACKLHEMGKKNLICVSYGISNNFESREAAKVAKKLNIEWKHINPSKKKCRDLLVSGLVEKFWRTHDNLSCLPSLREFFVLNEIKEKEIIPQDAVIINGQSGDFITGGHTNVVLNQKVKKININMLHKTIIGKHFTLNKDYLTYNLKERIKDDLFKSFSYLKLKNNFSDFIKLYEFWEWKERQTKYITQCRKTYEFFGYKWLMPLWDFELVDYWKSASLDEKKNQSLYVEYLKKYNYANLFQSYIRKQSLFPPQLQWLILLVNFLSLFKNNKFKSDLYKKLSYYGQYNHQYKLFKFSEFINRLKHIRNPVSLYLTLWLKINKNIL